MTGVASSNNYGTSFQLVVLNFVACGIIFCEGVQFGETAIGQIKLLYFFTYPLFVALIFFLHGIYLDRRFLICLLLLTAGAYYNLLQGKNEFALMFKNVFGMFQNGALFYMVLKANEFKVRPLFRTYIAVSIPVAVFGLIQEVAFLLHIHPIYDLSWLIPDYRPGVLSAPLIRIHSILPEPAFFAFALLPAVFASVHSWLEPQRRLVTFRQSIILTVAFVFSFSTVGYMGLAIGLLVLMFNFRKFRYILAMFIALPLLGGAAYFLVSDVRVRVDNTLWIVSGGEVEGVDISNLALFSNMEVAYLSYLENPWIGSGLGSHSVSYDRHIGSVVDLDKLEAMNHGLLNRQDASSLMLRLISETGSLGVAMFLIFLFRSRLSKHKDPTGQLWVINNGIFSQMILMLIRFGNYFAIGSFLFFWLLYASKRESVNIAREKGSYDLAPSA